MTEVSDRKSISQLNWVTGASGTGKTFICRYIKENHPDIIVFDIDTFFGKNFSLRKDNLLRVALEISTTPHTCIIFGSIKHDQLLQCALVNDFNRLNIVGLTIDNDDIIKSRLKKRTWPEDVIEKFVEQNNYFKNRAVWEFCDYTLISTDEIDPESLFDLIIDTTKLPNDIKHVR